MVANPLDVALTASTSTLVKFEWGAGEARYALWTSDVTLNSEVYKALPTMSVDYGEQHGGTKDEPITIKVPDSIEPIKMMINRRWYPVTVTVSECDPSDTAGTQRTTFKGRIAKTSTAKGQEGRVVSVQVEGLKAGLGVRLGLIVANECQWTFGDRICRRDMSGLTADGIITGIFETFVTVGGLPSQANFFWQSGTISVDGYAMGIRAWESGLVFSLFRPPPKEWMARPCVVKAGCNKTPTDCAKWGRLSVFGAIGTKILDYNPQAEVPG